MSFFVFTKTDCVWMPLIAYIWLYQSMNLLHRDISIDNVMYRYKNGKICGVLNDFDMAIYTSQQANSPLSQQRTGTRPFMALELLGTAPCKHIYRHDLESIMYVTIVLACFTHASKEDQRKSEIGCWFDANTTERDIRKSKREFLTGDLDDVFPAVTGTMTSLSGLVDDLYWLFRKVSLAISQAAGGGRNTVSSLDHETIGGIVTLQTFAQIFGL